MIADLDDREGAGLAAIDPDEPGRIEFLENEIVLRAADQMAEDLRGAMIVIDAHIVKTAGVVQPDDAAFRMLDRLGQIDARCEVPDANGVEFGALGIHAPSELAVIGCMDRIADRKEGSAATLMVAIDQDHVIAVVAALAADQRLLPALTIARVIKPRAVGERHAGVVFLDTPAHLTNERLRQIPERAEKRGAVGVFRLEHRADRLRQSGRVAQNLLPIVGTEPRVLVDERVPMDDTRHGPSLDGGRQDGAVEDEGRAIAAGHWAYLSEG